jgi:hypothetical protein
LWNVTFLNTVIHSLSRREIIIKSMSDNPVQIQFGIGSIGSMTNIDLWIVVSVKVDGV